MASWFAHSRQDRDKERYFHELYSLNDDSDEEKDTSNAREILRNSKLPSSSSISASSQSISKRPDQQATVSRRFPAILRTASEPTPGGENPARKPLPTSRNNSLLRSDVSNPEFLSFDKGETSLNPLHSSNDQPHSSDEKRPDPIRSVSTPNIGSVIMKNSTGINSMLRKRKRKDSTIKLVPEAQRIFASHVFFYVPPNDVALLRKARIQRARSYGATWTKEWTPNITHIVVDKNLNYNDVLDYLKPLMKSDTIPLNIILVNEDYPIHCTQFRLLVDPNQKHYIVDGSDVVIEGKAEPDPVETQNTDKSLELKKAKRGKRSDPPAKETPQNSIQPEESNDSPPSVWLPGQISQEPRSIESPCEDKSPLLCSNSLKPIDELDELIEVARTLAHLPIDDDDEEEEERPSSGDGPEESGSEEENALLRARANKRKYGKKGTGTFNQDNFSCMIGGTGLTLDFNPNKETIEILQELANYYERIRDTWRSYSYRRAIGTLKRQTIKVSTYDVARSLPTIGHRIAEKIEEIELTHRLRRLDNIKLEPEDQVLQLFLKIYGVGLSQASKWVNAGYKTLDDLQEKAQLTNNQRLGIEHFDELNSRIPREEVTALGDIVKGAVAAIDPRVEAVIGGSYRRGAESSGDIDLILTRPGTKSSHELLPFLHKLTSSLTSSGFLVAALAIPRRDDDGSKWHGACVLSSTSKWRRIDLLLVPDSEIGAALIYFTGDDLFNRSMRLLSSKKGWRLNQRGLYRDIIRGPRRVKMTDGTLIEGQDERKIFEILGVPWRPPEQRICH